MKIVFDKAIAKFSVFEDDGKLRYGCRMTNEVRNELNGRRKLHYPKDVVRIVKKDRTLGKPYMPRQFPDGVAVVTAVEVNKWHPRATFPGYTVANFSEAEFGTVRITTDASQTLATWKLDSDGGYDAPDGGHEKDYGYHFHYAPNSSTTLGCGRFASQSDAEEAALMVAKELAAGKSISVKVG